MYEPEIPKELADKGYTAETVLEPRKAVAKLINDAGEEEEREIEYVEVQTRFMPPDMTFAGWVAMHEPKRETFKAGA